jgi:hypothetical protein
LAILENPTSSELLQIQDCGIEYPQPQRALWWMEGCMFAWFKRIFERYNGDRTEENVWSPEAPTFADTPHAKEIEMKREGNGEGLTEVTEVDECPNPEKDSDSTLVPPDGKQLHIDNPKKGVGSVGNPSKPYKF